MLLSQLYLFWMSNQTSHYVSLRITLAVVRNDFLPFSALYRNGWAGNILQYILKSKVLLKSIIHSKLSLARTQKAVAFTEESWMHTLSSRDLSAWFFPIFHLFSYFPFYPISWCFIFSPLSSGCIVLHQPSFLSSLHHYKSSSLCLSPRVSISFCFFLPTLCSVGSILSITSLSFISCTLSLSNFFSSCLYSSSTTSVDTVRDYLVFWFLDFLLVEGEDWVCCFWVTGVLRRIHTWPAPVMKIHEQSDLAGYLYMQETISQISRSTLYSAQVILHNFHFYMEEVTVSLCSHSSGNILQF